MYTTMRKIEICLKKFSIFDFSHLFSRSSAFEGQILAKFQMAIKSEKIVPGRRLTPQMKDLDKYFHIKQIEKSYLSYIGQYIVSKFVKIWEIVKKFLRAKKALNFKKWLKFYLNMNFQPIFCDLTNNCTIRTIGI